ncbi:GTP-binding protein [Pampinifervens florentissimum]|uniref:GTP-binding protein n=1 Tax=Pampinifervens florentissimum TaxID=1632019 RepID=UPI0013B492E3|nr:GTPase domain-containing protein [Hydrogenobacter sp. T-8]QID34020.1 GTPase domain-containing protein [Hydrogenobacter sp. T-8]
MTLRILYHGLGMAGKTTNLEKLREIYSDYVSDRIHQQTSEGRTVYLDILSLSIKTRSGDKEIGVELFTTPGQERFRILRKWIFGRVDGLVLVLDSTRSLEENLRAYEEVKEYGLSGVPMVLQLNKRDVGNLSPEEVRVAFGDVPLMEAVAIAGMGVAETFRAVLKEALNAKATAG